MWLWDWLLQYGPTVLICAGLIALMGAIVWYLVKQRKAGKSSCGCSCGTCPMSGKCHEKN